MTSATKKLEEPTKATTMQATRVILPRSGPERMEETITVAKRPPNVENKGEDAWGFARSNVVPHTTPWTKVLPTAPQEASPASRHNSQRAMTPFDMEDEGLSEHKDEN